MNSTVCSVKAPDRSPPLTHVRSSQNRAVTKNTHVHRRHWELVQHERMRGKHGHDVRPASSARTDATNTSHCWRPLCQTSMTWTSRGERRTHSLVWCRKRIPRLRVLRHRRGESTSIRRSRNGGHDKLHGAPIRDQHRSRGVTRRTRTHRHASIRQSGSIRCDGLELQHRTADTLATCAGDVGGSSSGSPCRGKQHRG